MTRELHYELPPHLIAQTPAQRREQARMMIVDRGGRGTDNHAHVADLTDVLSAGDCLVVNDTRVLPARFAGRRSTGGRIEGLYVADTPTGQWEVLLKSSGRLRVGESLALDGTKTQLVLTASSGGGRWEVRPDPPQRAEELLERIGWTPLPPYIKRDMMASGARQIDAEDRRRYQTTYAKTPGAVAAPTAGLHLTPELLGRLEQKGVQCASVTLHVGLGTFEPIKVERLEDHPMHAEWYHLPEATVETITACRHRGGRIAAVGTTSARVLEACSDSDGRLQPGSGTTRLFIYPPYRFRTVDALLTNFHLPGSTLLALLFAFAGRERVMDAYREAIRREYRFYSFGDAMLIL